MRRFVRETLENWGFWLGLVIGLAVVVPKILFQYGIVIGDSGETWVIAPGFIAALFMVMGVFCWEGRFVYVLMGVGVLLNAMFYAAVVHATRRRLSQSRDSQRRPKP